MRSGGFHIYKYIILFLTLLILLVGCKNKDDVELLDPNRPIDISLWHYYNGNILNSFEELVGKFNETVGVDYGIRIKSKSYGDVTELESALYESANENLGSLVIPDIFATYPDNALRISKLVDIVALDQYFTQEELDEFRGEFLQESYILDDNRPYILPIAKSTENLFINKTDWEKFAEKYNYTRKDLESWDGILEVSKSYYEETGKSFLTLDSLANFIYVFAKQNGIEIISKDKNKGTSFYFTEEMARLIWEYIYVPYINGYYGKNGRFGTDDVKTGNVLAFVGSTSGAGYYPKVVTGANGDSKTIAPLVLPYPYKSKEKLFAINQGAGMCISASEKSREYAASIFLKWFTNINQNIKFAMDSSYLPVMKIAYDEGVLTDELNKSDFQNMAIKESMVTSIEMLDNYSLYSNKPYDWSYKIRSLMEKNISDKIKLDMEKLEERVKQGEIRERVIAEIVSENEFKLWYEKLTGQIEEILDHKP